MNKEKLDLILDVDHIFSIEWLKKNVLLIDEVVEDRDKKINEILDEENDKKS